MPEPIGLDIPCRQFQHWRCGFFFTLWASFLSMHQFCAFFFSVNNRRQNADTPVGGYNRMGMRSRELLTTKTHPLSLSIFYRAKSERRVPPENVGDNPETRILKPL